MCIVEYKLQEHSQLSTYEIRVWNSFSNMREIVVSEAREAVARPAYFEPNQLFHEQPGHLFNLQLTSWKLPCFKTKSTSFYHCRI
jgi:hypothetical protein